MTLLITIGLVSAIISYFSWCYFHELSHVLMAKKLVGIGWYRINIFPHVDKVAGFRWASCAYSQKRHPNPKEAAMISLAPRIPNILACIMAPFAFLFSSWSIIFTMVWLIFWASGVIDLINGSVGISKHSDLKKASVSLGINPWLIRSLVLLSLPTIIVFLISVILT